MTSQQIGDLRFLNMEELKKYGHQMLISIGNGQYKEVTVYYEDDIDTVAIDVNEILKLNSDVKALKHSDRCLCDL